jgi:hypothetical protein
MRKHHLRSLSQSLHLRFLLPKSESWQHLGQRISSVLRAGHLIDVIHTRHPNDIDVPTYKCGNHRIDYHFIFREVNEAVLACGVEPFGARIQSDHRGLFLDLDARILFGRFLSPMAPHALRGLQSRN